MTDSQKSWLLTIKYL